MLHKAIKKGEKILCEGAQASLLDIDFGSYPFVTSSNPTIGGAITGTGIGAKYIGDVYGVIKAYSSRVGAGPFVTELNDATGDKIRELGHEYGVTTKRPRRCGWLDVVALNYACMVNGLTGLCVNHLDTIGKFDKIKVCVAYEIDCQETTEFPVTRELKKGKPVYVTLPGWKCDIRGIRNFDELPENAKNYVNFIEQQIGFPITMVSNGPAREDIIYRQSPLKK
jgi:adenylosuccinate synthase